MGKVLAFINQKGGVGKTTSAINVALSLAVSEVKTLVIDLDPQANATIGLSDLIKKKKKNIYDILISDVNINEAIAETSFPYLNIIPSTNDLVGAEVELVNIMAREYQLKTALKKIIRRYDVIILDCPPSLGLLTINAFTAADSLLIPVQCEFFAMEGLAQLNKTIELIINRLNPSLEIEGLLLTMYDTRNNICKTVASEVKEFFKDKVLKTLIPKNVKLAESPSFGKCIFDYDHSCLGATSYLELSKELISRNGGTFIEKIVR